MGLYAFNWHISVLGDWKDISVAHVIIIIKSDVSTYPIVIIFFHGCVPEMFVISYSVTYCICVPGEPGIFFHYYCAVYDERKYSDTFWLADGTPLFVLSTISLSSSCKLTWRLYVFSLPISLMMIERIYIVCLIIIIKSEVWTITHCLGLGHEIMVSAVCLSIFLWLYDRQSCQGHMKIVSVTYDNHKTNLL